MVAVALGPNHLDLVYAHSVVSLELVAPNLSQFSGVDAVAAEKTVPCHDAAFRGLPVSHSSTFLRQRPRTRAALRLLGLHPQSRHQTWRCFNERFSVPIRRSRPSSLGNSGLSSRAGSSGSNLPLTLYLAQMPRLVTPAWARQKGRQSAASAVLASADASNAEGVDPTRLPFDG